MSYTPIVFKRGNQSTLVNIDNVISAMQVPLVNSITREVDPNMFNVYVKMTDGKEITFFCKDAEVVWYVLTASALEFPLEAK